MPLTAVVLFLCHMPQRRCANRASPDNDPDCIVFVYTPSILKFRHKDFMLLHMPNDTLIGTL